MKNEVDIVERQHVRADVRCKENGGAILFCDGENIVVRVPQDLSNTDKLISEIMNYFFDNGFYTYRTDRSIPKMKEILGRELRFMEGAHDGHYYVLELGYDKKWFTEGFITVIGYICYHRDNCKEGIREQFIESIVENIKKMLEEKLSE